MNSASVIAYQAAVMFILLFVGYLLYRLKLLGEDAAKQLSNIALSVINPIVIFNAYQTDFNPELAMGLLWAVVLALISQGVLVIAANIVVQKTRENFRIERFALAYSNCAFMGIPLVDATFGSEGVFYLTAYITAFNIFMWTHGVVLMSGESGKTPKEQAKALLKILLSPSIIAILLGLVCFFTGLKMPSIIADPLEYLGSMNTPLAMLVSGATIAKAGILKGFKCPRIYFIQLFKLLVVPMLLAVLSVPARIMGVSSIVTGVVLIAAAAPTASATIMFSYKYDRDAEYASGHFALSTIASVITMPLILIFSDWLGSLFCV